ncbi:MAG: hypothetical protein ACM3QW_04890, partial [Ignavibacteriales bacterium]
MKYLKKKVPNNDTPADQSVIPNSWIAATDLSTNLEVNQLHIQELLDGCSDAVIRRFKFGKN